MLKSRKITNVFTNFYKFKYQTSLNGLVFTIVNSRLNLSDHQLMCEMVETISRDVIRQYIDILLLKCVLLLSLITISVIICWYHDKLNKCNYKQLNNTQVTNKTLPMGVIFWYGIILGWVVDFLINFNVGVVCSPNIFILIHDSAKSIILGEYKSRVDGFFDATTEDCKKELQIGFLRILDNKSTYDYLDFYKIIKDIAYNMISKVADQVIFEIILLTICICIIICIIYMLIKFSKKLVSRLIL